VQKAKKELGFKINRTGLIQVNQTDSGRPIYRG